VLLVASCDGGDTPIQPEAPIDNDASLASLSISVATIEPAFSPAVADYTASVPFETATVDIDVAASDGGASLTLTGRFFDDLTIIGSVIKNTSLDVGDNRIDILVTAVNGTTTRAYSIVITRDTDIPLFLSVLKITNAVLNRPFDKYRFDYTTNDVPNSTASVDVIATAFDPRASVTINGGTDTNVPLTVGDNTIVILVTPNHGTSQNTYTIAIRRGAPDTANLSDLELTVATWDPPFDANLTDYTTTVGFFARSTQVVPTVEVADATISVNGTAVASGEASDPIALAEGGNTIMVNVISADGTVARTYTVLVNRQSALAFAQTAYVKASNTEEGDVFGWSISMSGDGRTLAVGEPLEDSAATGVNGGQESNSEDDSGAVYVFARDGPGTWIQQAYIKASEHNFPPGANADAGDLFGTSVALSRDGATLVVGAPVEGGGMWGDIFPHEVTTGAVYVFTRNGVGTWTQKSFIKPSNLGLGSLFGGKVALSGDGATLAAINSGSVYLFARDGDVWTQQAEIERPVQSYGGWNCSYGRWHCFSDDLALSEDGAMLAAGVSGDDSAATGVNGDDTDDSAPESGAIYLFSRDDSGVWTQHAYIKASDTEAFAGFGLSVALSGDGATLATNSRRAAYLFTRDGGLWTQRAYVKASNTDNFDALALSGDGAALAIVATGEDSASTGVDGDDMDNTATGSGAVYLFTRDGDGLWRARTYVKASNTDAGDSFGASVGLSVDGGTLAVGATGEDSVARGVDGDEMDNTAANSGAAYIFEL
jgi:hypothetical protein